MNGFAIIFLGFIGYGVLHTNVRSAAIKLNDVLTCAYRLPPSSPGNGPSAQSLFRDLLLNLLSRLMIITGLITLVTAALFW